ncbi:ferric-chelate reductase 1 [Pipra filicauda]|uniref:Ferric-chelate reductase 1 n=1 Tax=Pipra filicauda TaxID=649802 RepID=A0A6J2I9L6_9PASS|nr:ferric-chelate reductase 1 [Pipra filicauda]XP_027596562.1 ferric-chelate reductase 1 [Pipra filicauda]XP_027596563.1 ferric-chelate reductase 1 [Pipra filicauda]XP_039234279.1 ferric-chelate reductase 1 [Pipra filicauda]
MAILLRLGRCNRRTDCKMELSGLAVAVWMFVCFCAPVGGYPNGKVRAACTSMIPCHGGSPQLSPEHTITVNGTEFKPGDNIEVSLSGPDFEGFFIQARDAEHLDGPAIGSFVLVDRRLSQLLTCGRTKNSAVSQTGKTKKKLMKVYWIAPGDAPKHVQFLATVVKKYRTFWVKIPGPIVSQPDVLSPTTPLHATSEAVSTSYPVSHLSKPFSALGCGIMKFCIRNPSNCDPESASCFFLSFQKEESSVFIEMSGPSEGYLAFALSHDQWMGGDDAYLCINEDHRVHVSTAHLTGRSHPLLDSENALEDVSWRLVDGVLQCSFRRSIHLPAYKERFNLDASYYIFLADGESSEGGLIYKHRRQPLITDRLYNVTGPPQDIGGSRSPRLIKAHGALMFVAWITTVSIGVIVARFFKPVWAHSFLFGKEMWFQVHRMLMLTTVLLTSISFVLPFIYRGGWSQQAGFHPYLGCAVMALTIFQPLMAGFRPSRHAPRRQLFNWFHWSTGTTARILAVVTMFLGMDLPALDLPDTWDTYTMIGFVAWHVGIDVLLEIHSYCLIRKVEVIEDDRVQILQSLTSAEAEGHLFKQVVLIIYVCGNIVFLVAFLIAVNKI